MPLLPAGAAMFEALPFEALVLDRLGPAVGNGVITLHDAGQEGVLIIRDGVVSESVWVADGVRRAGDEALALIHGADAATVSACHLSDEAMRLIGPLIRGEPCYAGLRLEWVVWAELLSDARQNYHSKQGADCCSGDDVRRECQTQRDRDAEHERRQKHAAEKVEPPVKESVVRVEHRGGKA